MPARFAVWVGVVAIGSGLLGGVPVTSQQRARLVPQLGMGGINAVAFSPDGRSVVVAPADNTAGLWDVKTGLLIRLFVGHTNVITSVAFSPDGLTLVTGSFDQTARLWDVATGRQIRIFDDRDDHHWISSVAFSPDGLTLATGGWPARLWNVSSGAQIRLFQGQEEHLFANSVTFSRDGQFLLICNSDDSAEFWNVGSGKQVSSFVWQGAGSGALSRDGRFAVTAGNDATIRLWDAASGTLVRAFGPKGKVNAVALSQDARTVLSGSDNGTAHLWDVATGRLLQSYQGHHKDSVNAVAFSPDGKFVLTGSSDWTAELWNASDGQPIRTFEGHIRRVSSAIFSQDGRRILTGSQDGTARLWDTATGSEIRALHVSSGWVTSVAISPDNHSVLTGAGIIGTEVRGKLQEWDPESGQMIRTVSPTGEQDVEQIIFSPDGHLLLTGYGGYQDDSFLTTIWDAKTWTKLRSFGEEGSGSVNGIAISPDGRQVLTAGGLDHQSSLWDMDASSGKPLSVFAGDAKGVNSVAFSPGGRLVLGGGFSGTAWLWDARTGKILHTLGNADDRKFEGLGVLSVAISGDGNLALTGNDDGAVRLWDTQTGQQLRSLDGHSGSVTSVVFSPDSRLVLTGSYDSTSRLWATGTGQQLATLLGFENGGWAVVDPEGRFDTNNLDGGAPLVWVVDSDPMRPLPLEIFMRDYYTPRLLSRIMKGEKLPEVRSIAEIKNRVQPEVEIVSVSPSKTHAGRVDVIVRAASRQEEKRNEKGVVEKNARGRALIQPSGLQDLRLFRDGQLVANTVLNQPLKNGDFAFKDIQLPTSAKSVTFTAYAFNSGRIKSPTVAKEYAYDPGQARKPRAFLVQVGVNHYEAEGCELKGSVNDAEALSRVLAEKLRGRGLDVQEPVLLVSDDKRNGATNGGIRQALTKIAAEATPDDVFFLSFSGHGYGDKDGQFYIFPADIQGSCREVNATLLKNAITADDLAEWLRPIDAGEMTFVLDSCQSASSVEANDFKPGPMGSRGLGQLAYDKRIRILAASQGNQEAMETNLLSGAGAEANQEKIRGLLSFALTDEGLLAGKADWKPVDGKITVGEWLTYAADAVPKGLEAGGLGRGFLLLANPGTVEAAQTPAVFDFSKKDGFALEEGQTIKP
jgi:WD40 repeat protein/uncharacterized caspase-like protein